MIENSKGKMVNPAIVEHMAMENERLRGLLRDVRVLLANSSYKISGTVAFLSSIDAALSQQAELTGPGLAFALTGGRHGEPDEPAPAQDEREARINEMVRIVEAVTGRTCFSDKEIAIFEALATRPAQTEQQPLAWLIDWPEEPELGHYFSDEPNEHARSRRLYAAPQQEQSAMVVPEGWKLVPVEPTDEMVRAVLESGLYHAPEQARRVLADEYKTMLSVVHEPDSASQEPVDDKWIGYSEREKVWLENYESVTGFEPVIDDRLGFVENAEWNIKWFEDWSGEALRLADKTIPGSEFDPAAPERRAALSQQAELTGPGLAFALTGGRHGEPDEPAPAQDEREARINEMVRIVEAVTGRTCFSDKEIAIFEALATRPAQTEQQPVLLSDEAASTLRGMVEYCLNHRVCMGMDEGFKSFDPEEEHDFVKELRAFAEGAAPIAQTATQPEQSGLVEAALREAVAYLDENPFNEIASGSILHRVMGASLPAQGASK